MPTSCRTSSSFAHTPIAFAPAACSAVRRSCSACSTFCSSARWKAARPRKSKSPSMRSARAPSSTCRRTRWCASTSTSSVASSKSSTRAPGAGEPVRLSDPKGGISVRRSRADDRLRKTGPRSPPSRRRRERARRRWLIPALAVSLVLNALVLAAVFLRPQPPSGRVPRSAPERRLVAAAQRRAHDHSSSWATTTSSARPTRRWR